MHQILVWGGQGQGVDLQNGIRAKGVTNVDLDQEIGIEEDIEIDQKIGLPNLGNELNNKIYSN